MCPVQKKKCLADEPKSAGTILAEEFSDMEGDDFDYRSQ
jgi:hypothetical protein